MELSLKKLPYDLSVCKVESIGEIDLSGGFFFVGRTQDELSLVCPTEEVPPHALEREDGWRGFVIQGTLDFSLIGILSAISGVLANAGVGIFAVSTYDTDYVLVKEESFARAEQALAEAGYAVV